MSADLLALPAGLDAIETDRGLCLRGDARTIADFCDGALRLIATAPSPVRLEGWLLFVSDDVPPEIRPRTVTLPARGWNIAASVLRDVAYGEYESPFYFADVGFLEPPPAPDIGVEIVGPVLAR